MGLGNSADIFPVCFHLTYNLSVANRNEDFLTSHSSNLRKRLPQKRKINEAFDEIIAYFYRCTGLSAETWALQPIRSPRGKQRSVHVAQMSAITQDGPPQGGKVQEVHGPEWLNALASLQILYSCPCVATDKIFIVKYKYLANVLHSNQA